MLPEMPSKHDYTPHAREGDTFELIKDCFLVRNSLNDEMIVPPESWVVPISVEEYRTKGLSVFKKEKTTISILGIVEKGTRYKYLGGYVRHSIPPIAVGHTVKWKILNGPYTGRTDIKPHHKELLTGVNPITKKQGEAFVEMLLLQK